MADLTLPDLPKGPAPADIIGSIKVDGWIVQFVCLVIADGLLELSSSFMLGVEQLF